MTKQKAVLRILRSVFGTYLGVGGVGLGVVLGTWPGVPKKD